MRNSAVAALLAVALLAGAGAGYLFGIANVRTVTSTLTSITASTSTVTSVSTSVATPNGSAVFLNAANLPTWPSTKATTASVPNGTPEYFPGNPPQIILYYDNNPFTGAQGSYCWPPSDWGVGSKCVDIIPSNSSMVPVVAVYPSPTVGFDSTFQKGLQGFVIRLFGGSQLIEVFSGEVSENESNFPLSNNLPLNFTSGNYILGVYASYSGGEVSSYYNLTTVSSPAAYVDRGVRIQIDEPSLHYINLTTPSGGYGRDVGWEDWPLTITSNTITSVNLAANSVVFGTWVQFVPSHLTNVGPAPGVHADMLVAGALGPPLITNGNVSMMIRAESQDGAWGEVLLPLEGGPFVLPISPSLLANVSLNPLDPLAVTQNQTFFGVYRMVYDAGGVPSNGVLRVNLSIIGMINESMVSSIPNWLSLTLVSPTVTLPAYEPVFFQIEATASGEAPVGGYALLAKVVTGGQSSYMVVPIEIMAPVYGAHSTSP